MVMYLGRDGRPVNAPGVNARNVNGAGRPAAMGGVHGLGRPALGVSGAARQRDWQYTLHVQFVAADHSHARETAMTLAEGMGILRPEVQTYSAMVTAGVGWSDPQAVFCLVDGPDGVFCADVRGHPGWHAEAGVTGLRWGQGDVDGTPG